MSNTGTNTNNEKKGLISRLIDMMSTPETKLDPEIIEKLKEEQGGKTNKARIVYLVLNFGLKVALGVMTTLKVKWLFALISEWGGL